MRGTQGLSKALAFLLFVVFASLNATPGLAQVTALKQSIAESAQGDSDLAAYYRDAGYEPIWTGRGKEARERRKALFAALSDVEMHGLSTRRYKTEQLMAQLKAAKTTRDLGQVEVALSKTFLQYARDVQTGMLTPKRVDANIVRKVPYRARKSYLENFVKSSPRKFMESLPPQTPEYTRLMKEKMQLEKLMSKGGYGAKVAASRLEPGDSGVGVVQMRDRLIRMGYLKRNASSTFDGTLQKAVQQFQLNHGLNPDGVAGDGTLAALNTSVEERIQSIIVAMERERWTNMPRGKRHIMVNLTDFSAVIMDNGKETFRTRTVIGANIHDRVSPEFSDTMEHMVINPTWNVPRSIATKEYLPMLKKNPNSVKHLKLYDEAGRVVSRDGTDFTQFTQANFPFDIKQPPSRSNALGLVKFMFPNRYNIYLHDTPAKNLFSRETRAYSHGCIRLQKPFEFAYELLSKQTSNPKGVFHGHLETGRETQVNLEQHVPVHIMYRTAFTQAKGPIQFRRDIYGRDAKIWKALENEGVALASVRG
ncbi:L,D-transpeptidase family protein [Cognatishimia maritima]|uniref:Murein L,D-transpeptidase YcbB/YkuD n=1 Tax=Cognatishimia maritima TaxID=870908 RepID=A0A1M5IMI1_9RHOB|nr:L,D-transpeptidase family protein [Cognatishimia maritima]SHG29512.1 Murein L,D-transpeptidase YcbB/YkuD [Cognatishimia maritima]